MRILLVVYDNEMVIHTFPKGLAYIAAVLRREGHEVVIYSQDKNHYQDSHLTEYLDDNRFDAIGVSVIGGYYQYRKLLRIANAVNNSKNRPFFMLGGHGPAPEPDYFFSKTQADAIIIGEGEITVVELLRALSQRKPFDDIDGIAFRRDGKTVVTKRRELIKDIDSIPMPAYDLFPMDYYRLFRQVTIRNCDFYMGVLSGRGCTFECTFCYRLDKGFRPRSVESIIEEIKLLQRDYRITFVEFDDELLMSSVERTESLCQAFLKHDLKMSWICNGRLNYARPKLLELMRRSGCAFINYGIEAMDDGVLRNMRKGLTVAQAIKGVEATLAAGISPGLNIIFGNLGDNEKTLRKGVEFLLKYNDGAQLRTIRPVTPYPGSPLYYHAIEKGLLKDCADFYENKHVNSDLLSVNFTELSDSRVYELLFEANKVLLQDYLRKKTDIAVEEARKLYMELNSSFRGFRQS